MSAEEIATKSDLELSTLAARAMGWLEWNYKIPQSNYPCYMVTFGALVQKVDWGQDVLDPLCNAWEPCVDASQAIELAEFVCKRDGIPGDGMFWSVTQNRTAYDAYVYINTMQIEFDDPSFSRALTIAALKAHASLQENNPK
jgi:hypothetical protein